MHGLTGGSSLPFPVFSTRSIGWLFLLLFRAFPTFAQNPDTCGDYFFLPLFPECRLFLEAVPCFNNTAAVIVTMTTPSGELIHSFKVNYGSMQELSVFDLLKGRHIDGVLVRSTDDMSLYMHKPAGDSLVAYPIDSYGREYEVPNMTSLDTASDRSSHTSFKSSQASGSSSSSSSSNSNINNSGSKWTKDSYLYIFSPFNNTSIVVTAFWDLHNLPDPSSSVSIILDAFEIHKYPISSRVRYALTSKDIFAVVLLQLVDGAVARDNASVCGDVTLSLLDFLPPYFMLGNYFYLAFPSQAKIALNIHGKPNSTVDVMTDSASLEVTLGPSGSAISTLSKTSSAWVSTSFPISVYVTLTICASPSVSKSYHATPHASSSYSSSPSSSSSSSSSSSLSASSQSPILPPSPTATLPSLLSMLSSSSTAPSPSSTITCADNGFFLPSVQHYFTCIANASQDACVCTCPSVFQREVHHNGGLDFFTNNSSDSAAYFPLLVGELYDVSTSISPAIGFNRTNDVIINTNSSFMIFRHDLDNLNYLPAGSRLIPSTMNKPCASQVHEVLFNSCKDQHSSTDSQESLVSDEAKMDNIDSAMDFSSATASSGHCTCDFVFDVSSPVYPLKNEHKSPEVAPSKKYKNNGMSAVKNRYGVHWQEDPEDSNRPLIAVVVSLSVAILAVVALITGYMLVDILSRRKHVRNTKIRPFVS